MIQEAKDLPGVGRPSGPQVHKTEAAENAVSEFLASGFDAAEVDWREIDEDFDTAKVALSYRIGVAKNAFKDGAKDLGIRSSRSEGKVYLVHTEKVGV